MIRSLLLASLLVSSAPAWAAKGEMTPAARLEAGDRFAKNGNYTRALEEYNYVRNYHRDDPISLKAELAIADLYFKKGDYEQAKLAYEDFGRLHPRHEDIDWVVYRTGLCLYKRAPRFAGRDQTPTRQAVNTWTGYAERYPESEHIVEVEEMVGKARDRLARKELSIARFYVKREAWTAVSRRAEGLTVKYPDAESVPEALYLVVLASHRVGDEDAAAHARARLAEVAPDSGWATRADQALTEPAGRPADEVVFLRPYRVSGPTPGGGAPQ